MVKKKKNQSNLGSNTGIKKVKTLRLSLTAHPCIVDMERLLTKIREVHQRSAHR